jgi:hypothetical protein
MGKDIMSERSGINSCGKLAGLYADRGNLTETQMAVTNILSILNNPEVMEYITLRVKPGRFQLMLQMG